MQDFLFPLLIAMALGGFIGLQLRKNAEEGHYSESSFAGLRTSIAIALLGFLSTYLSIFVPYLPIAVLCFFLVLVALNYWVDMNKNNRPGATSELIHVLIYISGILVAVGEVNIAILLTIFLSIISSGRTSLYEISDKFTRLEIIDTLKFAIIVFLILPLLPTEAIDPWGIFNPATTWMMVILISGIGFLGYMATKFLPKKSSVIMTGIVGGMVSSTAVTTTMATQSKKQKGLDNIFTVSILASSAIMFIRVLISVSIINPLLVRELIVPIGSMLIVILITCLWQFKKAPKKTPKVSNIEAESPLTLGPAIKFAAFYVFIIAVITFSERLLGQTGIYLSALISGLADVDAITLSLSQLSNEGALISSQAVLGITLAVIANTCIKLVYVGLMGSKTLLKKLAFSLSVTAAVGVFMAFLL